MGEWKYWPGYILLNLGLMALPNGRAKRELTMLIRAWEIKVVELIGANETIKQ